MKTPLFLFVLFLTMGCSSVFGQVIDLDVEPEEELLETFEKSTMFYLSPVPSLSYNFGYNNMNQKLNAEFDLNQRRFIEFIAAGIAWRKKDMFYSIFGAFPIFPTTASVQNRPVRTFVDTRDVFFDFKIGKAVVANDRYYLILHAGAGFQARSLYLRQVDSRSFDLNDLPNNPPNFAWPKLDHFSGTYDVAIEYLPRAYRPISVMQSVQLGYRGGIGTPMWRSSEVNIQNSFSDRVSALYLRVLVVISREKQ
ncbi:hypothetical protein [Pararhodonellum marinum]|uniref:hypothetical protein n=1 Tax=Pararhodonellum marinum TaxID=2755358 RepID=UPI0018904286|nr:hypothetical protein [Pararhodonellum marinum]